MVWALLKVHRRRNPPSVRASLRCCCSLALASFDVMMVSRCPMVQGLIAAVCDIGLVVKLTRHAIFLHSSGPLTMNVFGCFGYSLVDFTTIVSRSGLLFGKSRDSVTEALPRTTSPVWTNHFLWAWFLVHLKDFSLQTVFSKPEATLVAAGDLIGSF